MKARHKLMEFRETDETTTGCRISESVKTICQWQEFSALIQYLSTVFVEFLNLHCKRLVQEILRAWRRSWPYVPKRRRPGDSGSRAGSV